MGPKSAAAMTLLRALCSGERVPTPLQRPAAAAAAAGLPEQLSTGAVESFFDRMEHLAQAQAEGAEAGAA
jgi:hypothetical protein